MSKNDGEFKMVETKLEQIKNLLEHLIAVTLYSNGASQDDIAESMHISKTKVNGYVKGMKVIKPK